MPPAPGTFWTWTPEASPSSCSTVCMTRAVWSQPPPGLAGAMSSRPLELGRGRACCGSGRTPRLRSRRAAARRSVEDDVSWEPPVAVGQGLQASGQRRADLSACSRSRSRPWTESTGMRLLDHAATARQVRARGPAGSGRRQRGSCSRARSRRAAAWRCSGPRPRRGAGGPRSGADGTSCDRSTVNSNRSPGWSASEAG